MKDSDEEIIDLAKKDSKENQKLSRNSSYYKNLVNRDSSNQNSSGSNNNNNSNLRNRSNVNLREESKVNLNSKISINDSHIENMLS